MENRPTLRIRIDKEFKLTIEKAHPKSQAFPKRQAIVTSVRKKSSTAKVLRHIFVAIRAWFLKLRFSAKSELAFDEEKQGLLSGGQE
ncbi:hypothetical protein FLAG1_08535 [Fusarium langsethiae]|uniref:Uncharacterized protein n=1 Tax=Fusarium langsethiae TaxID=179993 RepID=A0A0M9ES96_FUSLA|nr:hypothetical protein FLAG1_08535 [Fusarium langsethiae]